MTIIIIILYEYLLYSCIVCLVYLVLIHNNNNNNNNGMCLCSILRDKLSTFSQPSQLGVACKAGVERVVHNLRKCIDRRLDEWGLRSLQGRHV